LVKVLEVDNHFFAVIFPDDGPFFFAILKACDDSGDRNDAYGENGLAYEAVYEGTLAGLELTEDGNVDGRVLDEQAFTGFGLTVERDQIEIHAYSANIKENLFGKRLKLGFR